MPTYKNGEIVTHESKRYKVIKTFQIITSMSGKYSAFKAGQTREGKWVAISIGNAITYGLLKSM